MLLNKYANEHMESSGKEAHPHSLTKSLENTRSRICQNLKIIPMFCTLFFVRYVVKLGCQFGRFLGLRFSCCWIYLLFVCQKRDASTVHSAAREENWTSGSCYDGFHTYLRHVCGTALCACLFLYELLECFWDVNALRDKQNVFINLGTFVTFINALPKIN